MADQSNTRVIWGSLAGALIGFALMLLLGRLIARSIVQQHQTVLRLTQAVKQGDLSQRAAIRGHHEVAAIATSMNAMLETIGALLNQEASLRANLEDQLEQLIAAVTPVGQGDLRFQAHVNDTLLVPLAGVFNWMVEQLATLVARVHQSAALTNCAAQDLVEQAAELTQVAARQAAQLEQASAGMGQLAAAAGEVALSARTAVGAATETVRSAQRGGQAAFQVLEQVKQGTEEVQAIEAQLRLLNQHSEEIGSMVQLIEGIARQTQVLSLNAELQTTQMGPAQHGFGVVAEEVRRLALRTEEAVKQVTRLVQTLQGDIYSVTLNARTTTRHFHALAQLTDEAQQALECIWSRIAQQARGIETITRVASWQEQGAAQAAASIEQLVGMASTSGEIAHRQEEAAHHLVAIGDELLARVAAFRLPAELLPNHLSPAAGAAPGRAGEVSQDANHRLPVEREAGGARDLQHGPPSLARW
jgi:twitching motility protein PilJ